MKKATKTFLLIGLLLWTVLLNIYHTGVLPKPHIPPGTEGSGEFIPRSSAGLNHLILKGSAFSRGKWAGQLTQNLLQAQEDILITQLRTWIPKGWMLQMGIAGLITYFFGADQYIEANDLLEMYGTSLSAPKQYDFLADGYTRQLAYHGLHEVGQMMVDRGFEDMGCTVAAVPHEHGWIVGRNFDFEGGRIFDEEKLVKWVFPDQGFAHVSVIWAGMVGGVTGINEKGLYISINAAGSEGFRRAGTPSTLVLYKILRESATVEGAIQLLREAHLFITDIFVIMDSSGRLVRVERSPQRMEVIEGKPPFAVANHLVGKSFEHDATNEMRKKELTTVSRETRAAELVGRIPKNLNADQKTRKILEILRDKGVDEFHHALHLGNRMAIDPMIASHSVIVDSTRNRLYVGQGPSLVGKFFGYDLTQSFKLQRPVLIHTLPADPLVSEQYYSEFKQANHQISQALVLRKKHQCEQAIQTLEAIPEKLKNQSIYYHVLGDAYACIKNSSLAADAWHKAYDLRPAYARQRRDLEKKLFKEMIYQ